MKSPTPYELVRAGLGCEPEQIQRDVILTPHWKVELFTPYVQAVIEIVPGKVYEFELRSHPVTMIRTGIGAPLTGDALLALGSTPCKRLIFIGSTGALQPDLNIGDLVIPTLSLSGDGFSRYLQPGLPPADTFLQPAFPDEFFSITLNGYANALAPAAGFAVHRGTIFSTDSIAAQFPLLDDLAREHDCCAIEMETAAVFAAARFVNIQATALLAVSDSPVQGKSLFSGRTPADLEHYHHIKENILPKIVLDTLAGPRYCEG